MAENSNNNDRILMTLFQVLRDNQELYINQQWKIVHYAILLYAAIFAIFITLRDFRCFMYVVVVTVAVVILIVSSIVIWRNESSLIEARESVKKIRNDKSLKIIINGILPPVSDPSKSTLIFVFLIFANIISCAVLILAICIYK